MQAETTVANMEKLIPGEQRTLDALYEATKEETAELRTELAQAQKELEPWCVWASGDEGWNERVSGW